MGYVFTQNFILNLCVGYCPTKSSCLFFVLFLATGVRPPWWAVDLQTLVRQWGRRAGRAGGWIHKEAVRPPGYGTAGAHKLSPSKSQKGHTGGEGQIFIGMFKALCKNIQILFMLNEKPQICLIWVSNIYTLEAATQRPWKHVLNQFLKQSFGFGHPLSISI